MSCNSIKVDSTTVKVEENQKIKVLQRTVNNITKEEALPIKVSPRSYHIVSQDVYTIRRNSVLEPFFEDQINNLIDGSDLADEVSDLDNRFQNFSDGVTLEIGYLKQADQELAYNISTVKVSNDNNTAAIQKLDVVKVTEEEARAVSSSVLGAWLNGGESGAWFNESVSVISNVAYSAAKSASTLTASINSQQDQLNAIVGDIGDLEKQIDGKVETWFSEVNPVNPDGSINPLVEPYATWLAANDIARHTGDTYVYFEYDAIIPDKKNLLVTFRFAYDSDTDLYVWYVFEDDLASEAYQRALEAQVTADGKINTYWQPSPPSAIDDPTLGDGDLWLDSDDDNKMWRYQGDPLTWVAVEDKRIFASVERLDEATVDVDGSAKAKSSLSVNANGVISGFVAESDGSTSTFRIFADKFSITNNINGSDAGAPFTVDTLTNRIRFNGVMEFDNLDGSTDLVKEEDLRDGTTIISGDNILTGFIKADRIEAQYLSAISANLGTVTAGIMYNTGGTASNYSMKIDLNNGEIHIK